MSLRTGLLAFTFAAASAVSASASTSYNFSYTFTDSSVLSGTVDGTLQADNDTIFVEDFGDVFLNAIMLPSIEPSDVRSSSDFPAGALQPLLSLSGSVMDVFVCANGFNSSGNCGLSSTGGFFLDTLGPGSQAAAGDGLDFAIFDANYVQENFTISEVSAAVPLPAGGLLLISGLGFFAAAKRRRKKAA